MKPNETHQNESGTCHFADYEVLLTIKKINIYVVTVAGGDPDVSRVDDST